MEETRAKGQDKFYATPKQYGVCALIICVMIYVILGVALSLAHIYTYFAMIAGAVCAVLLYKKKYPVDLGRQIKDFDITVPLMTFILNWTGCELAASLFGRIASMFSFVEPNRGADTTTVSAVIGTVLIAPVCEELMFRLCGMGLLKKCSGKLFAILFPTLVFAAMHAFYNIQGLVNVFTGALFFAICYYYTGNVLYTMIAHMLHNLLCLPDFSFTYHSVNGYDILTLPAAAVYIVLFAAGMVWLFAVFRKRYAETAHPQQTDDRRDIRG